MSNPGRPRAFATDAVLDAAIELFWVQGYRSTTTRDLENALGLSQSSLYNAFGSKKQLLDAALDRYQARLTSDLLRPLESSDAGLEALDAFLCALGDWLIRGRRRGCMLINMMAEDGGASPQIRQRVTGYRDRLREALRSALQRSVALRQIDDVAAVDGRANMLLGVVMGLNLAARAGACSKELRNILDGTREQVAGWRLDPDRCPAETLSGSDPPSSTSGDYGAGD